MWLFKKLIVRVLTFEARLVLRKYKPRVIAVTGSVGKTSTKDAIFAALSPYHHIRKSEKSFNSDIGLPLTILGAPNAWHNPFKWIENLFDGLLLILFRTKYPQWLVLEVGADRPGDIRSVAKWLPVDVAVITRLPEVPVHVEYFSSPEEVIEEKASLITALKKDGTLILYGDDERVRALSSRTNERILYFGFEKNDVRASHIEFLHEKGRVSGMRARVEAGEKTETMNIRGTIGAFAFMPALAAISVAHILGEDLTQAVRALEEEYTPPPGRMHLIEGIRGSTIIDDTYNSSPAAAEAALETLKSIQVTGKRIAVLGDMLELGRFSVTEHQKLGALAAQCADGLFTVGVRARDIARGARDAGMPEENIRQFKDSIGAATELAHFLPEGSCVLSKGSQSMRMERVVEAIMEHPELAKEVLVRQEKEWRRR